MKLLFALALGLASTFTFAEKDQASSPCPQFLDHEFKRLHSSETVNLCELYTGQPMVLVNTASHCGYTHQFGGLEQLYKKYKDEGVQVVGFASDDFNQAAKSEEEAASICYKNFGVTFTMLAPTSVRGEKANEVFKHLNMAAGKPSWNFNKYIVAKDGEKIEKFDSRTKPVESKLEQSLIELL